MDNTEMLPRDTTSFILVVDDDASVRILARAVLEREGWNVQEAENGEVAIASMTNRTPDMVLLDVMMSGIDGFAVCSRIREATGRDRIPVLMMTGLDDKESIGRAYQAGATDFIIKPINWAILGHRVRYMLRASEALNGLYVSEARNRALLDAIPDDMLRIKDDGSIVEWRGSRAGSILGYPGASSGAKVYEVLPVQVARQIMHGVRESVGTGVIQILECETLVNVVKHEFEARVVKSGDGEGLVIVRDITERKEMERALRESEERYALASRAANDGLWDWYLTRNELHYSSRWKEMLGIEDEEIRGSIEEWFSRAHPADIGQLKIEINSHLDGITSQFTNEHRMMHKDGTYRWMLTRGIAVRDVEGRPYRMAGSQADITDRKNAEEQLVHDAFYDALTGLPNRVLFMDRLTHALKRTFRGGDHSFAVLFIDLDRFKVINDSLGHSVGDALLVETSRRLERCVRSVDTVARLGGDEFVVLCDGIKDPENALSVADRIQSEIKEPFRVQGTDIHTTVSIGIAYSSKEHRLPDDILRDADIAMYKAKSLGKARVEVFEPSLRGHAVAILHLENDLRRAIENREFRLQYQPIMDLETDRIIGLEALIRWQHPHRGLLSPVEFIPLAEETGLIVPMGEWVLRAACEQLQLWHTEGLAYLYVAVNVSPIQLRQPDFGDRVMSILKETGADPGRLTLEITETALMEQDRQIIEALLRLKCIGIQVSLDDFGTGYSALSCLQNLPVDTLKIDRSFVKPLAKGEQGKIIETIILLGKNLGINVVAEGIETEEQLDYLKEMHCQTGQGFFLSKPVNVEAITPRLIDEFQSIHQYEGRLVK